MTRTRFAPSPTGYLHIGGLRTAAYAYALAKHDGGEFLLRIEDTDQKREVAGAREKLIETLKAFNLHWDGEPLIQSRRAATDVYRQAAQKLVDSGHAYEDDGAIRLKVPPNETVSFFDFIIQKKIEWQSDQIPDAVLLKSDGFPTYHLASIVDDHESGITHVIRSVEWLPSTPIHLLAYRYLGYELPAIGHPTAILDPEGGKLSKRKGTVSVEQFLAEGYLPEAILNFIILLGWAPKDNRELFTLEEFVQVFDISGFQKSNPLMNLQKLDWFNGQYIRKKSDTELIQLIKPYLPDISPDIVRLIKDRITTLAQAKDLANFFFARPAAPEGLNSEFLTAAYQTVKEGDNLQEMAKAKGWPMGDFFMTLRLAICGQKITPPLTESMLILGKTEVLYRLHNSIERINK